MKPVLVAFSLLTGAPSAPVLPHVALPAAQQAPAATTAAPALLAEPTVLSAAAPPDAAAPLPDAAKEVRYLLVRGLFGNHTSDYFDGNLRRLKSLGLDARDVLIDTEGHRMADLRAIETAVAASPKPVVLIGHSRGGILAHDWYRRAAPELKSKVARLVAVQSPLRGTPLADEKVATRWGRLKTYWAGRLLFGEETFRTTVELTTRVRARVMAGLPQWTPEDLKKTYAVRSVIRFIKRHPYYKSSHAALTRLGSPDNDGRVPADSARIPGAGEVLLPDVDHDNTVIKNPGWFKRLQGARANPDFDPGDFTEALVRSLFR